MWKRLDGLTIPLFSSTSGEHAYHILYPFFLFIAANPCHAIFGSIELIKE